MQKLASASTLSQRLFCLAQHSAHIMLPCDNCAVLPPGICGPSSSAIHVPHVIWPPCSFHGGSAERHGTGPPNAQHKRLQVLASQQRLGCTGAMRCFHSVVLRTRTIELRATRMHPSISGCYQSIDHHHSALQSANISPRSFQRRFMTHLHCLGIVAAELAPSMKAAVLPCAPTFA